MPLQTIAAPPLPKAPIEGEKPHEIEKRKKNELLSRAKVVFEAMATRHSSLEGLKPSKQYCWVNLKEDRQIFYQGMGWERCIDPDIKSPFKKPDGTFQRADTILYEIDRDFYDALCAYNVIRGIEGIESAETGFIDAMAKDKIPTFKPNVK